MLAGFPSSRGPAYSYLPTSGLLNLDLCMSSYRYTKALDAIDKTRKQKNEDVSSSIKWGRCISEGNGDSYD